VETLRDANCLPTAIVADDWKTLAGFLAFPRVPLSDYRPVCRVASHAQGPDQVVWLHRSRLGAWDPLRIAPPVALNIQFGDAAELLGVDAGRAEERRGTPLTVEVLWRFSKPLPRDRMISYYLGNRADPQASYLDTRGLFRDRRLYADVAPGEIARDCIQLQTHGLSLGKYDLNAMIYPIEGFESPEPRRSSVNFLQARLLQIEILP
jgi:hypothetical protein